MEKTNKLIFGIVFVAALVLGGAIFASAQTPKEVLNGETAVESTIKTVSAGTCGAAGCGCGGSCGGTCGMSGCGCGK